MSKFDITPESLSLESVHTPCLFNWKGKDAVLFIGTASHTLARTEESYTLWLWMDGEEPKPVFDYGDSVCAPWFVKHGKGLRLYACIRIGKVYRLAVFYGDSPDNWVFIDWCLPETEQWQWTPCVLKTDIGFRLFYCSINTRGIALLKQAISDDGVHFYNDNYFTVPTPAGFYGQVKPALYKVSDTDYALFLSEYYNDCVALNLYKTQDLETFELVGRVFPERNDIYKAHLYKGALIYVSSTNGLGSISAKHILLNEYVNDWLPYPVPVVL